MTVGQRIRDLRKSQQLTQDQLAKSAGISKGFLSDVENDHRSMSIEYGKKVAVALGVTLGYLVGEGMPETVPLPTYDRTIASAEERLTSMAEDCIRLLIQANGAIPGGESGKNGKTVRQVVRELRHMYAEIETPTPTPEDKKSKRETDDDNDTEEDF